MRINFNERLEDNSEIDATENVLTKNRKISISEDDYSDELDQMLEVAEKSKGSVFIFLEEQM